MTSLHHASITGSLDVVKLLLENGAKLDVKENKGMRPLHYAAYNGKTDIVNLLLRCGSNSNEPTFNGDTPLHLASQCGHADIVYQLLNFGADVRLTNTNFHSALDVACENGRTKIVEILLQSGLCAQLIRDKSRDLIDPKLSATCLHLAAKNNHADIIRVLLLYGFDLNRFTHHGTALHEACRYGRYQAAKVLLECGIDINQANSQDQIASDVVLKQKVGTEIKCLIKEFGECVHAVSLMAHLDNHAGSLMFDKDEYITVLERNPSGNWRGFVLQTNLTTRFGYFPSTYVRLIDRNKKPLPMTTATTKNPLHNAVKHAGKYVPGANMAQLANIDEITCDISPIGSVDSSSKISTQSSNAPDSGISSHKSLNHSSPPNASLLSLVVDQNPIYDASTTSIYAKTLSTSTLRSFTNSKANCLLPSLNENIYSPSSTVVSVSSTKSPSYYYTHYHNERHPIDNDPLTNINDLLSASPNANEIVSNWLSTLNLQNYAENFTNAGYDLLTVIKMTPSDLIAIGVSDPNHRKTIMHAQRHVNLKDFDENFNKALGNAQNIRSLLELIHLDEYLKPIMQQGYLSVSDLFLVNCEDLEDIGIKKLGHQKRFLATIKRLQNIRQTDVPDSPTVAMSHAKSCENIAIISAISTDQRGKTLKPVPPKRIDSMANNSKDIKRKKELSEANATTSFYATLPRKRNAQKHNPNSFAISEHQECRPVPSDANQLTHFATCQMQSTLCCTEAIQITKNHTKSDFQTNAKNDNGNRNNNALTDIDSMLNDLNRQLDAMIEFEKSFKNC